MKRVQVPLALALVAAASFSYTRFIRPRVLNWGARPDEIKSTLPGDELLPNARLQTTRVVSVRAAPENLWPWLVQIGPRPRAGLYTYDWIERLFGIDIRNADQILPEYQHLEAGEFFALSEKGNGLRVKEVQEGRAIVLQWEPGKATWAFVLQPQDDRSTRLISRNRIDGKGVGFSVGMTLMEPASLVMERKMLLSMKKLAEGILRTKA